MIEHKVYLAGPITGLTFGECTEWREYVKPRLAVAQGLETGIVGWSPMRAKDYLLEAGKLSGRAEAYDMYVLSTAKGITYRDSWDVATCDLVLVNLLGAEAVSIGTVLEIGMAWTQRKPTIVVMEEGNVHHHAMLDTMAGWITDDLDYAVELTKAILLPDGVKVPR